MRQPSRIDWGMILVGVSLTSVAVGAAIAFNAWMHLPPNPPPPTAELEISVEDLERISTMFAGEAKKIRDARMDALEERIEKLEEGK